MAWETHLGVDVLTSQDINTTSRDFVRHEDALHSTVVALVAPEPLQFGLARMLATLAGPATPRQARAGAPGLEAGDR